MFLFKERAVFDNMRAIVENSLHLFSQSSATIYILYPDCLTFTKEPFQQESIGGIPREISLPGLQGKAASEKLLLFGQHDHLTKKKMDT